MDRGPTDESPEYSKSEREEEAHKHLPHVLPIKIPVALETWKPVKSCFSQKFHLPFECSSPDEETFHSGVFILFYSKM
jgi:hypothetical protein